MKIGMRALEAFAAVMTLGTATAAAGVLSRSQPAVTRSLRELEERTGLVLFERTGGRLVPTPEAHEFFESVREGFELVSRVERRAEEIHRRQQGRLSVSCLPAFSHGFIGRALVEFAALQPTVSSRVWAQEAPDLAEALRSREVDVGIVAYEFHDEAFACAPFTTCNEILALPSDHPLAARERIDLEDLANERLILLAECDPYRLRVESALADAGISPTVTLGAGSSTIACSLVAEGAGVSIVNPITALDFVEKGLMIRRLAITAPFVTTLVHRRDLHPAGFVRQFLDVLDSVLARALMRLESSGDAPSSRGTRSISPRTARMVSPSK